MGNQHNNPRGLMDYSNRPPWEQPEVDHMINAILQINDKQELERACLEQSQAADRGRQTDATPFAGAYPAYDKLWKIATRYYNNDYQPHPCRIDRKGLPWTFVETERVMKWAFDEQGDGPHRPKPPTIEYIARVLYRSVDEVLMAWHKMQGGLGLKKPPMES